MDDEKLVDALKALAHPVRLRIMRALTGIERNVGEIDEVAQIGQPALSQQLAVLRSAGLVKTRKAAKLVYYRIDENKLDAVVRAAGAFGGSPARAARIATPASPGAANFARMG